MKCILCESFSLKHICPNCQQLFLQPSLYKQKLSNNLEVFSFYKYEDIKKFLHTKHTDIGYHIFNILAQNSFKQFAAEFQFPQTVFSLGVDDKPPHGYSHTAILNKALKSRYITPLYSKLRAQNHVNYSGKSKEFRIMNPRDFKMRKFDGENIILVDDIITTGSTLTQATECVKAASKEVLFCLTLASVKF